MGSCVLEVYSSSDEWILHHGLHGAILTVPVKLQWNKFTNSYVHHNGNTGCYEWAEWTEGPSVPASEVRFCPPPVRSRLHPHKELEILPVQDSWDLSAWENRYESRSRTYPYMVLQGIEDLK